jgi:ribosomal protein S14
VKRPEKDIKRPNNKCKRSGRKGGVWQRPSTLGLNSPYYYDCDF